MANYTEVYNATLKHGDTPDRIFLAFNLDKLPEDFKGHSLSVSDVLVMNKDGKETAFYVDSAGFKELPDFLASKTQAQEKTAAPINLTAVADYMQKLTDAMQAAKPDSPMSETAYSYTVKRLEQANERIPAEHPQLKALLTHAAQSPDFNELKSRMATLNTEFTQHYSTAVQMTIDTSGKAEPKTAPAAHVRQGDAPPAPKPPAQGENVAKIEARINAGEVINLTDLSDAIKKDKAAAQTAPTTTQTKAKAGTRTTPQGKAAKPEQPSIKDKIAAGKQELSAQKTAPAKAAVKDKNAGLGDS
jgi:hypothetical protein